MSELHFIDLKECILSDNRNEAVLIRGELAEKHVFLWNIMSSPGAGKTTFITAFIRKMKPKLRIGVIEGDVESQVDAEIIKAENVPVVQLRTGGDCHLDSAMIRAGLNSLDISNLDLVIIENIGNLICPAEFDLGAHLQSMILSVPEGDDKAIKYPLMFSVCEAILISKVDYLPLSDFNIPRLIENVRKLNSAASIFPLSAKTGEGMGEFCSWLVKRMKFTA